AAEPELVATRGAGKGAPLSILMAPDSRTEARSVAETIRRLHVDGRAFRDIAVLSHSVRMLPREFEDELRRQGIPYVTSGGSGFSDRQEIKDVLGLLRLTVAEILNRLLEESGYLRWAELRAQRDGSPRALLNLRKVFQLAGRFERDIALAGIGDFVRHLDQVIDAELPVGEAAEEAASP